VFVVAAVVLAVQRLPLFFRWKLFAALLEKVALSEPDLSAGAGTKVKDLALLLAVIVLLLAELLALILLLLGEPSAVLLLLVFEAKVGRVLARVRGGAGSRPGRG